MHRVASFRSLVTGCAPLLAGVLLAGCSTSKVLPSRVLSPEESAWAAGQKIHARVQVVPSAQLDGADSWQKRSVTNLSVTLARSELFTAVSIDSGLTNAELLVVVRSAQGVLRCGTGLALTKATLGLFRDQVDYTYCYDFDLVNPLTGSSFTFAECYRGKYRLGFWPAKDHAFARLLKYDLARQRSQIEALANRPAP